jgi:hypothetical protein
MENETMTASLAAKSHPVIQRCAALRHETAGAVSTGYAARAG